MSDMEVYQLIKFNAIFAAGTTKNVCYPDIIEGHTHYRIVEIKKGLSER